ncbi:hypothetical protein COL31_24990, partial [Bacillus pseudomycoides]
HGSFLCRSGCRWRLAVEAYGNKHEMYIGILDLSGCWFHTHLFFVLLNLTFLGQVVNHYDVRVSKQQFHCYKWGSTNISRISYAKG